MPYREAAPPKPRQRSQRPTLNPADEAKLAGSSAELADSIAQSERCTEALQQFAADVDSERISMDGVVLEPVDEDDSLVVHIEESLRGLAAV
jgi:hypothetical protein